MANNNIEQYLEAMLAALDGDTVPDVPSPSWNIEKYLAAILTKLSSGGGSGGGVLVVHDVNGTLDKTWQEIHDADFAVVKVGDATALVSEVFKAGATSYFVNSVKYQSASANVMAYSAPSTSAYPTAASAGGGGND